ncbi:MAG TPA: DEAD/DEAH box helicase [Myxococcota bacterium]|nr:DEAD/DEAH box helicase [Myxococcota bacterium]
MDELFDSVRESAARPVWSQGGELARRRTVSRVGESAGELELRVSVPGLVVAHTVFLRPDAATWECSCDSRDDPCVHVVACAIALRNGWLSAPEASLGYRFARGAGGGLVFERVVVSEAGEEPFRGTLAGAARGSSAAGAPRVAASPLDQEIELLLGSQRAGRLPRGVLHKLVAALESAPDVQLDGRAIRASAAPCAWRARVRDDGPGFQLVLERDPPVSEDLGEGVALCGDVLHVLGASGLDGRERDEYLRGRRFEPDEATRLASEVLPSLRRRLPVTVESARLPDARPEAPRLVVETSRDGDALSVLATLVYGDPPRARVDAGKLVPLQGALPARDPAAEERLARHLHLALGLEPGVRVRFDPDDAVAFAARLDGFRGDVGGDAHARFFRAEPLTPRFEGGRDALALSFESATDPRAPVEAGAVVAAWRAGQSLVPLASGGFAPLPEAWLARHGALVADLVAARDAAGGTLPASALPDLAALARALDAPDPPGFTRLRPLLEGFEGVPAASLPADLAGSLRDYQRRGVDWLAFLGDAGLGALLADDMGLGKTLQALCAVRGRTLVVAPTSVLFGWGDEAARFRPALRRSLYHGPGRRLDPDADLTFTSYAILRLDRERLAEVEWDAVVLDEAQAIKNPESQAAQAAYALRARRRVALTGTPVENRLDELWSVLHFLNPGLLGGRRDFETRVARKIADGDAEAAAGLRRRLRPFVLRRRKDEVARELPPRQEVVVHVTLSEGERALYDAVRAATLPGVVAQLRAGGSVLAALEALLRLRQACCHPALLPGHDAADDGSAKLEALLERLETAVADGHRALVFSQWTSLLDLVEPALRGAGVGFTRLDGSTRDRAGVVASFADPAGPPVLLVSLRAGGTGLNLTAADHVFLLDPWWNPAVEDQAADRAHRIGQTRPVLVHRLVARDSIEESMLALQARKRGLAQAAFEAGAGADAGLGREDLLGLLEDAAVETVG